MPDFKPFAKKVSDRFNDMQKHPRLFVVGTENRVIEQVYLDAFPEGTNQVYKVNREYDCSCCKNFLRNIGNVVAIVNGKVETVWDIDGLEYPFDVVTAKLREWVLAQPITSLFASPETKYGNETTRQLDNGTVINWNHFYGIVVGTHYAGNSAAEKIGKFNTNKGVFERGLKELTTDSLTDIIELIKSNSLYRGEEHLAAVRKFVTLQAAYNVAPNKELFVWANVHESGALFRNTVIGTLAQDLSAGIELETAVRSFETKVAPTNYKRTTALITPMMVKNAMKTIDELGIEPSLHRRFATIEDVNVNDVLWVNSTVKNQMKGAVETLLMSAATSSKPAPKTATQIGIEEFMTTILPQVKEMEVLVSGSHQKNLMSITAPADVAAPKIFMWDNNFGWSYNGNITDSIKEKVKAAGGNVTSAKLRFSLSWFNLDDLDIHVHTPSGQHVYFSNKQGILDVDMNVSMPSRDAVENCSFTHPVDGVYRIVVDNWSRRETTNVGAVIEIESDGKLYHLSRDKAIGKNTIFATVTVKKGVVVEIKPAAGIEMRGLSQETWGIKTEEYVPVETLMYSPNHWGDNKVGNKHHFFILKGCRQGEATRGFYNEFLSPKLMAHRKVFEVLGDKMLCAPTDKQLSGVGFSSTNKDSVTVLTRTEKSTKIYTVQF